MAPAFDPQVVADLRAYSARWGADPLLVQGPGGNTSIKADGLMLVKASGMRLDDAERADIFVTVRLRDLAVVDGRSMHGVDLRPSIETSLHSLMPHRVVCHVHMVDVIAHAIRADAEQALAGPMAGLHWAWVPYMKPGDELGAAIAALVDAPQAPDIVILGNHGVVVGGNSCAEIDAVLEDLRIRLAAPIRGSIAEPGRLAAFGAERGLVPVSVPDAHLAADPANLAFAKAGSFYPDHVVFLGRGVTVMDDPVPADGASILYLAPGMGALLPAGAPREAHEMAGCLGAVLARLPGNATVHALSAQEEEALIQWDAEAYRKALAAASPTPPTDL